MIQAAFISDLHLHPNEPAIVARFHAWVEWAATHTQTVYILGDFFHAWAGDDTRDAWSDSIALKLAWLNAQGVAVYFMHGNRDFLIGPRFAARACMTLLTEPAFITLGGLRVMLVHGDRYCTKDKAHQRFRRLTRNRWFVKLFLRLPRAWRMRAVARVRHHSQAHRPVDKSAMDAVPEAIIRHATSCKADVVIHGHTHKPEMTTYQAGARMLQCMVLSDWEASPAVLCYNEAKGFFLILMG